MRRVAAGAVRYGMCSAVFVMAFSGTSYADTTASLSSLADQARVEAHKWRADTELVQVELLAFGFGIGPSGYPDVNKTGPPGGALFHFRFTVEPTRVENVRRHESRYIACGAVVCAGQFIHTWYSG